MRTLARTGFAVILIRFGGEHRRPTEKESRLICLCPLPYSKGAVTQLTILLIVYWKTALLKAFNA